MGKSINSNVSFHTDLVISYLTLGNTRKKFKVRSLGTGIVDSGFRSPTLGAGVPVHSANSRPGCFTSDPPSCSCAREDSRWPTQLFGASGYWLQTCSSPICHLHLDSRSADGRLLSLFLSLTLLLLFSSLWHLHFRYTDLEDPWFIQVIKLFIHTIKMIKMISYGVVELGLWNPWHISCTSGFLWEYMKLK